MDGRQRKKMSALQSLQVPFPQTVRDHVFPHGRLHAGKDNEGPSTHLALCRLTYRAGTLSPWKLKEPSGTKEEQTQASAADVLDLDEDSASLVHNAIQEMIELLPKVMVELKCTDPSIQVTIFAAKIYVHGGAY
ncbi:hypothetical protein Bbelb_441840 [Branchiostoma belcheri]|nr:hypothetical protein Bbelb_441840 [Branchiostoma belcheri]